MADSKLTALTADTSPTSDDLTYVVNDPSGTPGSKKVTLANAITKAHGLSDSTAVGVSGGVLTSGTDVAVADGGTGASNASGARTNLGLVIGTDVVAPNQDTTGKSAKTDALNSATTVVNVSSATAPSSGQVLTATSSTAATWQTPSGGTGSVATDTIWDTKGDLVAATGADAATKVAIGTDGKMLMADSTASNGVSWQAPASAVKVAATARMSGTGSLGYTSLVSPMGGAGTLAVAAGTQYLTLARHTGQTLAELGVLVSATSLTAGQTIDISIYEDLADGGPGTQLWNEAITIGTSTGAIIKTGLSRAMPVGSCWISITNPSGNAGSVTLRSSTASMGGRVVFMGNVTFGSVMTRTGNSAAPADMTSYVFRSAISTTEITEAGIVFPIIGARLT